CFRCCRFTNRNINEEGITGQVRGRSGKYLAGGSVSNTIPQCQPPCEAGKPTAHQMRHHWVTRRLNEPPYLYSPIFVSGASVSSDQKLYNRSNETVRIRLRVKILLSALLTLPAYSRMPAYPIG